MADTRFHFVDTTRHDKASKRQMRRFVMKGKNAGKTFHRRSRLEPARQRPNTNRDLSRAAIDGNDGGFFTPLGTLGVVYRDLFPTFSLPVKVAAQSLKIINEFFAYVADKMYPPQLGLSLEEAKCSWLPVLFADEATIDCNVSLMQACNEMFLGEGGGSPKALYYLSQTFTHVRRRLQGAEALSDGTIGIVLSLVTQEQIRRENMGAKVHIDGLRRMVELRGGLDQFEENRPLLLKICKIDLMFALQHGGPPLFFRDRMSEIRISLASRNMSLDLTSDIASSQHNSLDPYLQDIMLDALAASSLLNKYLPNPTFDVATFQEIQVSICYRLFMFRRLERPGENCDIQVAYHIGLTVFMMTLFLQVDRRRIIDSELISLCVKDVLESRFYEPHESGLILWLLVIGGIWLSGDVNANWISPILRREAQRLGLNTWEEGRSIVIKFPWIYSMHDEPGRVVWSRAHGGNERHR